MNRIDNCEGVLVEAVSALGHLFFEGCESQAYTHARQRSIVLTSIEPPQEDAQRIIDFITALILVTYVEYGDDNIEQASLYLQKACKMALYYGLNILDHNAQEGHLHESHFIRISNNDAHLIGLGRRVWWEVSFSAHLFWLCLLIAALFDSSFLLMLSFTSLQVEESSVI
jgi:hypothetical protein